MPLELRHGEKTYLKKGENLTFRLDWAAPKTTGFIRSKAIHLDFGCLYELKDGKKGCIQDIGKHHGHVDRAPFVKIFQDAEGKERLEILGENVQYIQKLLIFVFFYETAPKWREAGAHAVVHCEGNDDVIINVDEIEPRKPMCAIARIKNRDDGTLSVKKVVEFFDNHEEMDREFAWGLQWLPAEKDPAG